MREPPGKNYTMKNKLDSIFPVVISSSWLKGGKGDSKKDISRFDDYWIAAVMVILIFRGSKVVK